jgi:hypothetical protein
MAVMLKCGAIFLHIPKTGGSWVTDVLADQGLIKKQIGHIHADLVRILYYARTSDVATRGLYDWAKSLLPRRLKAVGPAQKLKRAAENARQHQQPFCFCFVRNPADWYESWWRYMYQRSGIDWADESDLHGWHPCGALKEMGDSDFNGFVRNVISARPGFVTELFSMYDQPGLDFVGHQETLADDLVRVLQKLQIEFDEARLRAFEPTNVSSKTRDPIDWDPETRHELEKTEYAALLRYGYAPDSSKITTYR